MSRPGWPQEDGDGKLEAINKLVGAGDAAAIPLLRAMQEDALHRFGDRLVIGAVRVGQWPTRVAVS